MKSSNINRHMKDRNRKENRIPVNYSYKEKKECANLQPSMDPSIAQLTARTSRTRSNARMRKGSSYLPKSWKST